MYIEFKDNKIKKLCELQKEAQRTLGQRNAEKLFQRLYEIKASESLSDLSLLPAARCHPLKSRKARRFAVDLVHPFRLVFELLGNPQDYMNGTEIDLKKVTSLKILEVVDYHE